MLAVASAILSLMAVGPLAGEAAATHFRGGNISYQQTGAATNATFESTVSFRCTAFFSNPCNANVGDPINISEAVLNFGDGASSDGAYTVVAVNAAENFWVSGRLSGSGAT